MFKENSLKILVSTQHSLSLFLWLLCYVCLLQVTYFTLRTHDVHLYFVGVFPFDASRVLLNCAVSFLVVLPVVYLFLIKSKEDIFAFIYSPLILVGGVSGVMVLIYSDLEVASLFFGLYILLPFLLTFLRFKGLGYSRIRVDKSGYRQLLFVGVLGVVFYVYLMARLRALLGVPDISEVYEFRAAFAAEVMGWEKYAIPFSKYLSAFALAAYAIATKRSLYLVGVVFIFVVDYMLAGNKSSLAFLGMSVLLYYGFAHKQRSYTPLYLVVPLVLFLLVLGAFYYFSLPGDIYVFGLYDRLFNVSSGLFVRYRDYAMNFQYFGGGDGLLGILLGGVPENYHDVIGAFYFSEGVSANADLISDGYINFGVLGSIAVLLILRLLFSERDNEFYRKERNLLVVMLLPYTISIFSMGLQTSLLTGGLFWALLLMKLTSFGPVDPSVSRTDGQFR